MQPEFKVNDLLSFIRGETAYRRHRLLTFVALLLICAVVLAELEPGATRELSFFWAFLHWIAHIVAAITILALLSLGAVRLGVVDTWAVVLAVLVLPLVLAPVSLLIEAAISQATGVAEHDPDGFLEELSSIAIPAIGLSTLTVLAVFKAAEFAMKQRAHLLARFTKEPSLRSLFPDLPHTLGDDLISVSANDHYVHLRTSDGSTMISLKFADCVEKLTALQGLQVHRSHWVRLKHVAKIRPNGSSYVCLLNNGSEIPVSRRKYAELKRSLEKRDAQ